MPLKYFRALAPLFLFGTVSLSLHAAGDVDDFYEMKVNGAKFWSILESLPYASEGRGPVMYVFEYSECPYCQAMHRDFGKKDMGIEFRRMFVPVSERSARETGALGKSRDIADYHAFMEGKKRAPPINNDNAAIRPYNTIITAATKDLPPILKQNGWPLEGFSFPQYAWMENGKVFTNAGYTKASFSKAVARAKKGNAENNKKTASASKKEVVTKSSVGTKASGITRRNPSILTFKVQGISLGMYLKEVENTLTAKGYTRIPNASHLFDLNTPQVRKRVSLTQMVKPDEIVQITGIKYSQTFNSAKAKFDPVAVKKAIIKKYGQPDSVHKVKMGNELRYIEVKNAPTHKDATLACKKEVSKNKSLMAFQVLGKASQATELSNWLVSGDAQVRETCPAVVKLFNHMVEAWLAPSMSAVINLQTSNVTFDLRWGEPVQRRIRQENIDRQNIKDSAPAAELDF